mmetsp:Transcript_31150/g.58436  ORF Transcript_31150/g.58436 Transcript_31150/m.58436 type:complete len:223 (+) Transcript_31150:141-809(+)
MKNIIDEETLKKDLEAKLHRLVHEERLAQHRYTADEHPCALFPPPVIEDDPPGVCSRRMQTGKDQSMASLATLGGGDEQDNFSLGSRGHPNRCKPACRFHRRKGGCREGAACKFCHECIFLEPEATYLGVSLHGAGSSSVAPVPPGAMQRAGASEREYPSVGSFGHPVSCAPPCKYNSKSKGCKDGAACDHCHLCRWKRHGERYAAGGCGHRNPQFKETIFV